MNDNPDILYHLAGLLHGILLSNDCEINAHVASLRALDCSTTTDTARLMNELKSRCLAADRQAWEKAHEEKAAGI